MFRNRSNNYLRMLVVIIISLHYSCNFISEKENPKESFIILSEKPGRSLLVIAGQSNGAGTAELSTLDENKYLHPSDSSFIFRGSKFEILKAGVNNRFPDDEVLATKDSGAEHKFHGPELSFSFFASKPNYIVKVAKGGTSLLEDWKKQSPLRKKLIDDMRKVSDSLKFNRKVFYWNQFEHDISNKHHEEYFKALKEFFTDIQEKGNVKFDLIILAKVNPHSLLGKTDEAEVILDAQKQFVLQDPKKRILLSLDNLGFNSIHMEKLHYDSDAQVQIGKALANIVDSDTIFISKTNVYTIDK